MFENVLKAQPTVEHPDINVGNMDAISRQGAIEPETISEWKKEFREYVDSLGIARDDWKGIIEYIDKLPSVQPERKTGHWVYRPEWSKYSDVWSCSECGEKTSQSVMGEPRFKYCPMCGAKMEGGEQDDT